LEEVVVEDVVFPVVVVVMVEVGFVEVPVVTEPPPAQTVGMVLGCPAVAHVAAVGHAVVATVGEADSYGVGPGIAYVLSCW